MNNLHKDRELSMTKQVDVSGCNLLRDPLLNKGTAFSVKERKEFALQGLLATHIETIEEQLVRCRDAFSSKDSPLEKHIYLRALQDRNEVLFYRFVVENLEEILPIIYTPVVGQACQLFHHIYRQPRGVFISYPDSDQIDNIIGKIAAERDIRVIVVTDGERILGLGDQGAGGLGIPIGKLSLYVGCGGVPPENTLPIILDVGTNNQERLADPEYMGWRHERIVGDDYYNFVDKFVSAIKRHLPEVLLQFEDFAQQHAYPLLERYRDQLCAFNDDIQGTAAVVVSGVLAAVKVAGQEFKEQRIAIFGAGSAGCGIAEQLVQAMINEGLDEKSARSRFYLIDRFGLLHEGMGDFLSFQKGLVQDSQNIANWNVQDRTNITLAEVITNAKPTVLIGVSGQPGKFSESIVKEMADYCDRPIIFPLSNPTSREEAVPQDVLSWTQGRALIATGSPFAAVNVAGRTIDIAQCNNCYIFPGIGLAVLAANIKRISDSMMMAAAVALSELAPAMKTGEGRLLPELHNIREVSKHIAQAVIKQAVVEGHCIEMQAADIKKAVECTMWQPQYSEYCYVGEPQVGIL